MVMKMNCRHFRIPEEKTNSPMAQHPRLVCIRGECYHLRILSINSEKIIRATALTGSYVITQGLIFRYARKIEKREKKGNFFVLVEFILLSDGECKFHLYKGKAKKQKYNFTHFCVIQWESLQTGRNYIISFQDFCLPETVWYQISMPSIRRPALVNPVRQRVSWPSW